MAWIYLLIAAALEVGWAVGMKYTHGLTRLWPSVGTIIAMILSFVFLALAVKTIPIGTGYAIWTGIGTTGAVILGIILFHEPVTAARIACIALILSGVIGLKATSKPETADVDHPVRTNE